MSDKLEDIELMLKLKFAKKIIKPPHTLKADDIQEALGAVSPPKKMPIGTALGLAVSNIGILCMECIKWSSWDACSCIEIYGNLADDACQAVKLSVSAVATLYPGTFTSRRIEYQAMEDTRISGNSGSVCSDAFCLQASLQSWVKIRQFTNSGLKTKENHKILMHGQLFSKKNKWHGLLCDSTIVEIEEKYIYLKICNQRSRKNS